MKKFFLLSVFFTLAFSTFAGYLKDFPVTVTQPDGTEVHCFVTGDEYYNWVHDENGFTLIRDPETGVVVYAQLENGELVATNYPVGSIDPATIGLKPWLTISAKKRMQMREEFLNSMPKKGGEHAKNIQNAGTLNNLVIYIRFSGETEFPAKANTYNDWFNKDAPNYPSLYAYFKDLSLSKIFIPSTFYPTPSGNTILSYQDSYPRSYFQPYNATTNPNGYKNDQEGFIRLHQMLRRAIVSVSSQISSSLNIDYDNDNYVDNICFIARGNVDGWSDMLWPHRMDLSDVDPIFINGKQAMDYNLQVENHLDQSGSSILTHEMFHTFGAPDLYRYNDKSIDPVGPWDLMNMNITPPQSTNAYMKFKYGKWISNIPEIIQSGTYTLNNVWAATNNAYKIASPNSTTEYFVIEYRNKSVYWDSGLPGSGLIIYRVNTTVQNGNAAGPPDEVYIFRPGGSNTNTNGSIEQAFFSSQSGRTVFNNSSNPPCFLSNNQPGGISISNIGASGGATMSFDVSITGACPPPLNMSVTITSDCSAQLSWNAPASSPGSQPTMEDEMGTFAPSKGVILSSMNGNTGNETPGLPEKSDSSRDGWLTWSGNPYDGIGTNSIAEFIVTARFTAADLASNSITQGSKITKIALVPQTLYYINAITLCIYQGGSSPTNPGSLVYQQPVSQSLTENVYNEIALTTPYTINTTQELWIGYYVQTYGGYPAGCDAGPRVPDKGDLIFINNTWTDLYTATNYKSNANWNIRAYVVTGGGPSQCKYNVYRDGTVIASNISETSYLDKGFSPYDRHTWSVKVACAGGGESAPVGVTKESCITGVKENEKIAFSIVPNPASNHITISAENDFKKVEIINFLGQTVFSQSNEGNTASYNVSNLMNGVYFVRIISYDGMSVQKFVKR